ncbi:GNAT family N-acetyltransferase [Alteromonadaceae bacterium M269]|nr:GNAT family N-acetyltransferase [Alteromonadaceae bacterium M269]
MQSSYGFVLVDLPVRPFVSTDITYQNVSSHWEKQAYFELRQQVFKKEQNLHFEHEKDANDFIATPIVAIANLCGVGQEVVGGVRVFKTDNHTWFGGRLCVKRPYRGTLSIGKKLINEAVTLAKKNGCDRFFANIQHSNVSYFERLFWKPLYHLEVAGTAHVRMEADLSRYPLSQCQFD